MAGLKPGSASSASRPDPTRAYPERHLLRVDVNRAEGEDAGPRDGAVQMHPHRFFRADDRRLHLGSFMA